VKRVLIIGNGAIGVALGAELMRLGFAPGYVGREGPLAIKALYEGPTCRRVLEFPAPDAGFLREAAVVLVAVKAFDLTAALASLGNLTPGTPVVPFSNGAVEDVVRAAAARRPELVWRLGFCTFGVSAPEPGRFVMRSRFGEAGFGPWQPENEAPSPVERELTRADALYAWHPNIRVLHHRKWLYNTVINTLVAARRLPCNGDILGDLPMLTAVFNEAYALGGTLWGAWPLAREELYKGLLELVQATMDNENSMARDRRLGRQTESAYLAGLAQDPRQYPLLVELHKAIAG